VTPSKTLPQIEAQYTAAKADALHDLEIAEAAARHAWQNTKADADETFLLAEAAAKRDRTVTTANVQKTYADAYYAAYTVYAQSLVAAGADYQRQAADAQQLADVATAQADTQWWTAMYTARPGVLTPLISYNLPWVDFQIALAHAEADWATSNAPHYVASQTTIADAHASYAHALADAEQAFATDYYPALETYLTAAAGYRRDRQVALAGVTMTYVSTLAPALKTHDQAAASAQHAYEQAAAGAKRAHTISGDQAAYTAALAAAGQARSASTQTAAAALRSAARGAEAGRIRGAAQAEKSFVVNEAGAWQTFVIAAAGHLETLLASEAQAEYDLVEAVVTETAAYWMLATRAYADRMVVLAGTGSPWAQYHAAAWVAHADWVDQVAPAERDRRIAAAEAARDREVAEAEAEKNKTIAKAQAQHQRAVEGADAAYERADAEADAVLHDVHFVVVRLQLPAAGGGPPLASSLLGAAEPLLVTELLGLHDFFGELSQGFAGDGTYLGIIDSLLARKPERDELGYSNYFHRCRELGSSDDDGIRSRPSVLGTFLSRASASHRHVFGTMRLDADRGMYGLCQAVQHIRPQCALAFEEFTENLRRNACVGSDFPNESAATMNGSTQMAAERLLGLRLQHSAVPLAQFPQFFRDQCPFTP
jgi:hypothetical protein